jgi:hypothetical protein
MLCTMYKGSIQALQPSLLQLLVPGDWATPQIDHIGLETVCACGRPQAMQVFGLRTQTAGSQIDYQSITQYRMMLQGQRGSAA